MKFPILFITLFILHIGCKAQSNLRENLFLQDTAIVYIGIHNKFKKKPNQSISQISKTKGVLIKINPNFIEIESYYKGIFNIEFKTADGIKKIVIISEPLKPSKIKR